jgi:hypothetical protein
LAMSFSFLASSWLPIFGLASDRGSNTTVDLVADFPIGYGS